MKSKEADDVTTLLISNNKIFKYNTFLDLHVSKGDKLLLITDHEKFKLFSDDIYSKWKWATISFVILLIIQLFGHSYLSYFNLKDCESKIYKIKEGSLKIDFNNKDITYICASYVGHIFMLLGYFIIGFFTCYKQTKICFQIFEVYIVIMFISDLFFCLINP
jgi:hypothetical protein